MDKIKEINGTYGQEIQNVLLPTLQTFQPLLLQNESLIRETPVRTERYGSHPRQELDIYSSTTDGSTSSILVFFYGGGLVQGDKAISDWKGLVYANLGSFFARRGITTVIPNYRLVNSEFGGHDAVFPSGGQDVSLVLKWIEDNYAKDGPMNLYIMGNSGGGVHMSTYLFLPQFLEQRRSMISGHGKLALKGVVQLAVPAHFKMAEASRLPMLQLYYGSSEDVQEKSPCGLLRKLQGNRREDIGVPKALVLVADFDPMDEVKTPMNDFVALWNEVFGDGVEFDEIQGHNHISPTLGLLSGDSRAEVWAEKVVQWIKK